jgi:catabolite regulation protein CreA
MNLFEPLAIRVTTVTVCNANKIDDHIGVINQRIQRGIVMYISLDNINRGEQKKVTTRAPAPTGYCDAQVLCRQAGNHCLANKACAANGKNVFELGHGCEAGRSGVRVFGKKSMRAGWQIDGTYDRRRPPALRGF